MTRNFTLLVAVIFGWAFLNNTYAQSLVAGQLDPTFANAGELADSALKPFQYSAMSALPDGAFVISRASHDTIYSIRFLQNGNRDISFGLNFSGLAAHKIVGFSGAVTCSALQADRKTLIAGSSKDGGSVQKGFVLRLKDDGSIDSTFGTHGLYYIAEYPQYGESVVQVTVQPDGKILVLDDAPIDNDRSALTLLRLDENGALDLSFDTTGKYSIPFSYIPPVGPMVFKVDQAKHVNFGAYCFYQGADRLYQLQLNENGALNPSFGSDGIIMIDSTNLIDGNKNLGLNFQRDGKLISVQSAFSGDILYAVSRYNVDGSKDQGFGVDGLLDAEGPDGSTPFSITHIDETYDGKLITAGTINVGSSMRTIFSRINSDGSLDSTFGIYSGHALLNCFQWDNIVHNMIVLPDNKVLINGMINEKSYHIYEVARILAQAYTPATGIEDVTAENGFNIYPNPTTGEILLQANEAFDGTITITDIAGKTMLSAVPLAGKVQSLNVAELPAGIYIVIYHNGENNIAKKLVKQ